MSAMACDLERAALFVTDRTLVPEPGHGLEMAYLVPGQCSRETIMKWTAETKCGFAGYHGANLECAIWDADEARAKLKELEEDFVTLGVEKDMFAIEHSNALVEVAVEMGWKISTPPPRLGGFSIGPGLLAKMREMVPGGSVILEIGSGEGTRALTETFRVYSIEHDASWLNHARDAEYIFAPMIDGWYSRGSLEELPKYSCLLVDGPIAGHRAKMADNLDLFDLSVPVFFDDSDRGSIRGAIAAVEKSTGRKASFFKDGEKEFAVI